MKIEECVFCVNCEYYIIQGGEVCIYHENIHYFYNGTQAYKDECREINEHCDCKWFKKKQKIRKKSLIDMFRRNKEAGKLSLTGQAEE